VISSPRDVPQFELPTEEFGIERRRRGWLVRRALLAADLFGLAVGFALAEVLRGGKSDLAVDRLSGTDEFVVFLLSLPVCVLIARAYRLYDLDEERTDHSTGDEVARIFQFVTVSAWLVYLTAYVTGIAHPNFGKIAVFWAVSIVAISVFRACARALCRRSPTYLQNTIIIGCGDVGQVVARKLVNHPEYGVHLVGFLDDDPRERPPALTDIPVLGSTRQFVDVVRRLHIERVILAFSRDSHEQMLDIVRATRDLDVQLDVVPRLFEMIGPGVEMHHVEGMPLLAVPASRLSRSNRALKRSLDLVVAVPALVLLSPVFLLIAIAIKLDSRGPVFFRQVRMGSGGRPFRIWKFRTMQADADARKHEVAHLNSYLAHSDEPVMFKVRDDPRITRVGRFLRKTSLDEVPQLINVVRGDMSLVGPRPLIPEEDQHVSDWSRRRLDLRPGITGLWQVLGRNEIPFDEMLALDCAYVGSWSVSRDLRIMFRTIPALAASRSRSTE
jgi:exopolysaccharide biosynthesis polyprenyl glycosylphosphotransferase